RPVQSAFRWTHAPEVVVSASARGPLAARTRGRRSNPLSSLRRHEQHRRRRGDEGTGTELVREASGRYGALRTLETVGDELRTRAGSRTRAATGRRRSHILLAHLDADLSDGLPPWASRHLVDECGAQQLLEELGIGLAAGCLHHLPDEEAEHL